MTPLITLLLGGANVDAPLVSVGKTGNVGIGYSGPSDFTSVGADNLVIWTFVGVIMESQ